MNKMVVDKKADNEYILAEERQYLGKEVGDFFVKPKKEISGYESIQVELLSPIGSQTYKEWVQAALYTSLCTWDREPHVPVTKMQKNLTFKQKEKILFTILKDRPISVALEGVCFNFKLTGVPRAMTHQIVRHRDMAFGQESYRVASCYSCSVRAPQSLIDAAKKGDKKAKKLLKEYESVVKKDREMYKKLINSGVPMEQARCIMPMGTTTKITVATQLAFLIKYISSRTIGITQDEHTYIVCLMLKEIKDKQPKFYKFLKWYTADKRTKKNFEETMKIYGVL